ncbi:MAG: 23S rRNA pseudouridine1911/1915/1917 synthase, partial [Candidatus Omnitrophota bacterium]
LVIPSPKEKDNTLVNIVNNQIKGDENSGKLHPCHRLDKDTSGVILFSKGKRNQKVMMDEFQNKRVQKKYTAFIQGKISQLKGIIDRPVKSFDKGKFRKHNSSLSAETRYSVELQYKKYTVVEVEPVTGRTNQIRIHFSDIGHPLVGERKYAFKRDSAFKFKRTALHAKQLTFIDPIGGEEVSVKAELAEDMKNFLDINNK